ncbi:MAG: ornithine carbamoyltransferase [Candidatus Omnitrophota bacterium]|jgi:ornithine carbamoyltransferase
MIRHFISLKDFSKQDIYKLVNLALDIKRNPIKYKDALSGKCVGLLFEKPSLRTKAAFCVGAYQLGGHAVYYAPSEVQLGKRETTADVSRTVSRFFDTAVLRTFSHDNIIGFAKMSSIPVINALSDAMHPSQILGDLVTMCELKGDIEKLKIAYIGDGNNVCNSLIHAFAILGGNLVIANPKGYEPDKKTIEEMNECTKISGAKINIVTKAEEAAKGSDVLYTDVWASMGQEKEKARRKKNFSKFQINDKILGLAKKDCIVMHCLPAHRGEEITDSVMESENSEVFLEAENRLHTAKAILVYVFKGM